MTTMEQDAGNEKNPSIQVRSCFGDTQIECTDGVHTVTLDISKRGIERLIAELEHVLEMAD